MGNSAENLRLNNAQEIEQFMSQHSGGKFECLINTIENNHIMQGILMSQGSNLNCLGDNYLKKISRDQVMLMSQQLDHQKILFS